jgi:tripartite-type tricarboxylate transporter receptor subunit TctC
MVDVIAGHVDLMFGNATEQVGAIRSGQVRGLGVSSLTRHPALPDLPTIAEAGVPGFEMITWYGACAPAGVPPKLLDQLNADTVAALQSPGYQHRAAEQGIVPAPMSRAQYTAFMAEQAVKWASVTKQLGLQPN